MACLAEKIIADFPEFGFTTDESVTRIREHSLSLDRCKRFTEIPRISFERNLKPLEWAVFAYYYSLAPNNHPSELSASTHLKIGRNTLVATLDALSAMGMVFFDNHARTRLRIVNISHPEYWNKNPNEKGIGIWTNPRTHVPRSYPSLPERVNDAKEYAHAPGRHVRLPYLLFQTLIHPNSKFLYGLLCYLGITTHPTARQLATTLRCSAPTVALRIAELEEYRMIYSEAREPVNFGEHTRYFYHLTDVAFWKTRKAELWYPGGEKSLIVRLDATGFASSRNSHRIDDTDDFRPHRDASEFFTRPEPPQEKPQSRQEISQVRQEKAQSCQETPEVRQVISQIRQESSEVRQVTPQIRRDVESSQAMLPVTSQRRQVMPQIRQNVLRQVTSQIRQLRTQLRQIRAQRRQIRSQSTEKPASSPCTEARSEEFAFAKNTLIRNTNNKNTDRKELRARERWAPVERSFHPRLINIAQAAAIAWRERDYKCDRALWNATVEEIAFERGQKEAILFVSYVKEAHSAYGREFPYSPQLMQDFLDGFRAGRSWASILGSGCEEPKKVEIAGERGSPDSAPGSHDLALVASNSLKRDGSSSDELERLQTDSGTPEPASRLAASLEPILAMPLLHVAEDPAPEPQALQEPGVSPIKPRPIQLTHANILDFPAQCTAQKTRTAQAMPVETPNPAEPSPRRIQLEKAIAVLTSEMKSRDTLKRSFGKLDDNALFENLCFLFGAERIRAMVSLYV